MDSHEEKTSDESTPDTSHLVAPVKQSKKSNKKMTIIVCVVIVVVIVAGAIGGGLYYKKTQDDKKAAAVAAAAKAAKPKQLTPEQQITAELTDNVQKQMDALKEDDGKAAIETSTEAAQQVGRNLHETDLKD